MHILRRGAGGRLAVLHRLRCTGTRGLIPDSVPQLQVHASLRRAAGTGLAALAALAFLTGCGDRAEPLPPPDPILQDSLGITSSSQVAEVVLVQRGGGEVVTPDTLRVTPGQYVSFRSGDHWPRRIRLLVDGVGPEVQAFLERTGPRESPPLVHAGARWVLEMGGAPPGAYPFVVEGPRSPGRGVLLVEKPAAR